MGPAPRRRRSRSARRVELRGRGPRGPVLPSTVPAWRTRAERFDGLVLEALSPINQRWHEELRALDIAVDEVPPVRASDVARIRDADLDASAWPPEVLADAAVPLARLIRAGVDRNGGVTRARIVLFRRPLELRAKQPEDLAELLHEVLVEQVATYLGVDAATIDPAGEHEDGPDEPPQD